jgi:hypothetical protein
VTTHQAEKIPLTNTEVLINNQPIQNLINLYLPSLDGLRLVEEGCGEGMIDKIYQGRIKIVLYKRTIILHEEEYLSFQPELVYPKSSADMNKLAYI